MDVMDFLDYAYAVFFCLVGMAIAITVIEFYKSARKHRKR